MNVNPSPIEQATPKVEAKKAQLKLVVGGQSSLATPKARYSRGGLGFALSVALHFLVVGLTIFFSSQIASPPLIADSPKGSGLSLYPGMEISIDNALPEGPSSATSTQSSQAPTTSQPETIEPLPTTGELAPEKPETKKVDLSKAKKEQPPATRVLKASEDRKVDPASSDNQGSSGNTGSTTNSGEGGTTSGGEIRPGGGGSLDAPVSYQQAIAAHLSRHKRYPEQARMRGLEGLVTISLTLGKGGDVRDLQIINSDSEILSGGAKSMVERATPFPNIPEEMAADWITLKLPIKFNLY